MASIQETVHGFVIRSLVARQIQCPQTGEVLDCRTCAVVVDADGDPVAVYSPRVGEVIRTDAELTAKLAASGYRLMER